MKIRNLRLSIESNLRVLYLPEKLLLTEPEIRFPAETDLNEKQALAGPKIITLIAFLL
jgi:hypothetical protein